MNKAVFLGIFTIFTVFLITGCTTEPFHKTVDYVDMERFSGDWYVIALIPTYFEKEAFNGIENYQLDDKGIIRVKYTYSKGQKKIVDKTMYQKGWIYNEETNAEWRIQPLWPLKLPYYIMELGDNYDYTVIGTNNYKYLWIMSRTPLMDMGILSEIINRMIALGYDSSKIIMMPQDQ
jgi:apolipoprotein D and lipocalin family protein